MFLSLSMQLKVTKLKGGRGNSKKISLFLDSEICSNFRLIRNNDCDIQVRHARASSYVADFNTRNKLITGKLL